MKSKPVDYLPGARLDVAESAAWYEEQETGVGEKFSTAVLHAEHSVARHPALGTPHRRNTRKWRIGRFPHSLIYREETKRIVIVAVAHGKRREGYWLHRLR
jgi:plasmid stabilization system protein ParE